jgi:hypothetical protein
MEEALSFFRAFEAWIYVLLGIAGLIYIRKFILSWQELRVAGFGLERDNAQSKVNQAAVILVLIIGLTVTEFVLVSYIAPAVPGANPVLTPTLNLLATSTVTLAPTAPVAGGESPATSTVTPTEPASQACIANSIAIRQPQNGETVSGVVEVSGTADTPNFGFYKIEMKHPGDANWQTIQAGNTIVINGKLGDWDTRRLSPGEYQVSLVIVDNEAKASQPCFVKVQVIPAVETSSP